MASSISSVSIGDRVIVQDAGKEIRRGVVKFVGETHFGSGVWCGLCLDLPLGKNDGTVRGVKYFECATNFGVFVPVGKVQLESKSQISKVDRDSNSSKGPDLHNVSRAKKGLPVRQSLPVASRAKQPPGRKNFQNLSTHVIPKPQDRSMVAKARAAAAGSQKFQRQQNLQLTNEITDHQVNASVAYQATDNSKKAKNDTFTVTNKAFAKPAVPEEATNENSLLVDDLQCDILIENISQYQLQTPLSSSTPQSSGDGNHPVTARHILMVTPFTPHTEAVVLEEASRVGQLLTQSTFPIGLPDVVKQLQLAVTGDGERSLADLGSVTDDPVDAMTGLRDQLRSSCQAFDTVAVIVGHLMMKVGHRYICL
jgi:hypothetical protein